MILFFIVFFISFTVSAMEEQQFKTVIELDQKNPRDLVVASAQPHSTIINWYIGESGITENGAKFYHDEILKPALDSYKKARFNLYDLVGWQALRNRNSSLSTQSKVGKSINSLQDDSIKVVFSSEFFTDLSNLSDEDVIHYKKILSNKALHIPSLSRKPTGIQLKEVLGYDALEPLHDMDTAHTYSALQYLEGIYLIKQALKENKDTTTVSLLLPNDEFKYYVHADLNKDLQKTVGHYLDADEKYTAQIKSFTFGNGSTDRPYILRDKKVAPTKIKNYIPCKK